MGFDYINVNFFISYQNNLINLNHKVHNLKFYKPKSLSYKDFYIKF